MVKKLTILLLTLSSVVVLAQKPYATVQLSRSEVFVQQPFKATVKVYSPTWFSDAVDFGALTVKDAFIVPFTRTLPGVENVNGQQYSTITFFYLVYPYNTGTITFPALNLTAQIPPVGGYKGEPVTLTTTAKKVKVKPLPKSEIQSYVAKKATITDQWNKSLRDIKVGDVIERTITIKGTGTIPNFISYPVTDSIDFANIYEQSNYTDQSVDIDKEEIYGTRTITFLYLFNKAGDFTIPSYTSAYFNPFTQNFYYKKTRAIEITVQENDNLNIVASLQDSLNAVTAQLKASQEEVPVDYKKMVITFLVTYKWWIAVFIFLLAIRKRLYRSIITIKDYLKNKRLAYLASEKHAFKLLLKAIHNQDVNAYFNRFNIWLQFFHKEDKGISFNLNNENSKTLYEAQIQLNKALAEGKQDSKAWKTIATNIHLFRKQTLSTDEPVSKYALLDW